MALFRASRYWPPAVLLARARYVPSLAPAPAITLQADGSLLHKPSPAGGDAKLYLTTAGEVVAKTAAAGGDRRISLSAGAWLAS